MRNSEKKERHFGINRRMQFFLGLCLVVLPFLIGCGDSNSNSSTLEVTPEPLRLIRILCTIYKGVTDDGVTKIVDGSPMEVQLSVDGVQTHRIDVNRECAKKFAEGKWDGASSKSTEAIGEVRPERTWEQTD